LHKNNWKGEKAMASPLANKKSRSVEQDNIQQQLEMLKLIFNSIHSGLIVTDAEGYITHLSQPFAEFLKVDPEEQIGRHCTDVIEGSRMHIVARTGKAEIAQVHRIKGRDLVIQRIPIKKNGEVIGVCSQLLFKDLLDVRKLFDRLSILENKLELYEKEIFSLRSTHYTMDSIVGVSKAIEELKKDALKAAANHLPVLITGESGTGKDLFAQAIHHASVRRLNPFVRINCSAIPKELLESELFGYSKGAFTGASPRGKPGKFELADNGTLFLDEIGDLPLEMQPKLLHVIEQKEFERVGDNKVIKTDFRLIAATNQNLAEMMENKFFRTDLFYRLNVIPLNIPPLRERKEDIVPIAKHLLNEITPDSVTIKMDSQAEEPLTKYDWPGNVRELSNVLERTLAALEGDTIHTYDLPYYLNNDVTPSSQTKQTSLKSSKNKAEKIAILDALKSTDYHKVRAAELLGIHRTLLYKKMKKHGL
jgi:transcriptional regulator with PAS, ATPase and Fis domain